MTEIGMMVGKTFTKATGEVGHDELEFTDTDGLRYLFYHSQDCCEGVFIEDIVGDLLDLIGSPLLQAEEVSSESAPAPSNPDSYTWTFYKFATNKGSVTVRWLGESNGYYSESVDFRGGF